MDQTDRKHVLAILCMVAVLITLRVETCEEDEFQTPEFECCPNCREGLYVLQNCSSTPGKTNGVICGKCRTCEEIGQITVSNCTQFTNTQCAMGRGVPLPTEYGKQSDGEPPQTTLYGCSSAVVAVFMLAVIMAVCLIRISKSADSDKSSAGEPFHTKDTETV